MSIKTFIQWFFNWSACLNYDFINQIDPVCGHTPTLLACDATHIGIPFKQMDVTDISSPDTEEIVHPQHVRYERVFMPFHNHANKKEIRESRSNLLILCKSCICQTDSYLDDEAKATILLYLPVDVRCKIFLTQFIHDVFQCHSIKQLPIFVFTSERCTCIICYLF